MKPVGSRLRRMRFRGARVGGERRIEFRVRLRRPKPVPPMPFEGHPPKVLDLGMVKARDEALPVDMGFIDWRPPGA